MAKLSKHFLTHPPHDSEYPCLKCGRNKARMMWSVKSNKYAKNWCSDCGKERSRKAKVRLRFMGDKMYNGTLKTCSFCGQIWPRLKEHWVKGRSNKDKLQTNCRHCVKEQCLWRNFGIKQKEKDKIHKYQGGRCGICKKEISTNGDAEVDHDHNILITGKNGHSYVGGISAEIRRSAVNGLLCHECNIAIGIIGKTGVDMMAWAKNAVSYELDPPAHHVLAKEVYN